MTPAELLLMLEGRARAVEVADRRAAQLGAWIFGAAGVSTSADALLGKPDTGRHGLSQAKRLDAALGL